MILVTAGYGNQGRKIIPRLAKAGARVRGLRRTPGGEAELIALGAAEVMIGDASDPATLARAMEGVEAVYHIGPSAHPKEREMGLAAIDAALAAGVKHFVFSSVLHAIVSDLIQHEVKRDIEEKLVGSGLNFTILQPADYMQVLRYARAFDTGEFVLAWSLDRRQSVVDVSDIAEVAARVLLEGAPHYGATYELSAPGCFTGYEIGEIIAKVTGRPIRAIETTPEARMTDHFKGKLADGADYPLRVFQALRKWYSAHDFVGNPNVLTMLLGRPPTTLEEFIRAEYALKQMPSGTASGID
ncbi:MAG TPA: NmrA family NAD(P)-binding protein [Rhizomicrobium sp.]|nr:NmrA family NAD(P)-binding protein [Rhizomicrobium sp.]